MNQSLTAAAVCTAWALISAPAFTQTAAPDPAESETGHAKLLAIRQLPPSTATTLIVTTPAFKSGADMPYENTQYRGNIFPGVHWSKGPTGTRSYVVVMQGALGGGDDLSHGTSIHFLLYNVPADVTQLDAGLKTPPAGAVYGSNVHGFKDSYAGPHTHNFTKHGYHLQVLALNTTVVPNDHMNLTELAGLIQGHVLASGEVIGMAAMDPDSPEAKELRAKGGAAPGKE